MELKYVNLEIVMSLIGLLQYFSQYYIFATNVRVLTRLCHVNEETNKGDTRADGAIRSETDVR